LKKKVDDEVDKILTQQYQRGMKLITENREVLDVIAKTLIEKEKINGLELLKIINDLKPELVP
jgi:cell division protease FtsH